MKRGSNEIIFGILIFIIANILAFVYHYDRFYSIFLLGLFLILKGIYKRMKDREFLTIKRFIKIYIAFFILGILGDLILGIWISKLWYYPTYTLANYINLYLFIYPLGGIIMVYTFVILESLFIQKPRKRRIAYKNSLAISKIFFIVSLIGLISSFFIKTYQGLFLFGFIALNTISLLSYINLKINKNNLLERFLIKSLKYGILIIIVAYTQGLIHEIPNVFAKEWIYQNIPFHTIQIFGIPIIALFGWIILIIGPYTLFESILALNKVKNFKDFRKRVF